MDISVREQISSFHRRAGSNRRKSTFSANPAAANAYLCLVVASGLATGLAFQLPGTLQPVRRAARASTIGLCKCIHDGKAVSRRSAAAALLLPVLVSRHAAAATKARSGKWAKHYKEFTEEELAGFTKTDSGMQYLDVAEGTGAVPRAGDMGITRRSCVVRAIVMLLLEFLRSFPLCAHEGCNSAPSRVWCARVKGALRDIKCAGTIDALKIEKNY